MMMIDSGMVDSTFVMSSWTFCSAILGINQMVDKGLGWDINFIGCYLGWIGYIWRFIMTMEAVFKTVNKNVPKVRQSQSKPFVKMKSKRNRCKKEQWYCRRKNQMKRQRSKLLLKDNTFSDKMEKEWWNYDGPPEIPLYQYLHLIGDHVAREWDDLCKQNSLLVDLLGPDEKFVATCSSMLNKFKTTSFALKTNEQILDMTSITSANHVLRWQSSYYNKEGRLVVFDSGATITISPIKEDFIDLDTRESMVSKLTLNAVGSQVAVKGVGTIRLLVYNYAGHARYLETTAFWVPDSDVTLFSVCRYCWETRNGAKFLVDDNGCTFHFSKSSGGGKGTFEQRQDKLLPTTSYSNTKQSVVI